MAILLEDLKYEIPVYGIYRQQRDPLVQLIQGTLIEVMLLTRVVIMRSGNDTIAELPLDDLLKYWFLKKEDAEMEIAMRNSAKLN